MPRPLRPIDDTLVYHVITRGNNRAPVFFEDDDYTAFLESLGDLKERRPFSLFGYCLMSNHVHLLVRAGESPISRLMQSLLVSHTLRCHRRHKSSGHIWQGRFKSPIVQDDAHLLTVLRHIEANPVRARVVKAAEDYRWSSFSTHGAGKPDPLLDPIPEYEALAKTPKTRQRRWAAFVAKPPAEPELAAIRRSGQTGLSFGSPDWVNALGARLGLDLTIRPRGRPPKSVAASSESGKPAVKKAPARARGPVREKARKGPG